MWKSIIKKIENEENSTTQVKQQISWFIELQM
jgi:hypothetical protein